MTQIVRLENWSYGEDPYENSPYMAPELRRKVLHGEVYGHPRFKDGAEVTTSRVVEMNPIEKTAVTSSGTHYQLGKPDPEYAEEMRKIGVIV